MTSRLFQEDRAARDEAVTGDSQSEHTLADAVQTAARNLAAWSASHAAEQELSALQLDLLARRLADAAGQMSADDISLLHPVLMPLLGTSDGNSRVGITVEQRLSLCRAFCKALPRGRNEEQPGEQPLGVKEPTVLLPEGALFGAALKRFSALLPHARILRPTGLSNICEELAESRADFALLPLEDSERGRLFHFYEQIDRFELHISCTADIPLKDRESARIALLCREPSSAPALQGTPTLECTLFDEKGALLGEVLRAADQCGLSLRRIDTAPSRQEDSGALHTLVFSTQDQDFQLFEVYLRLFIPRAVITSRYIHMERNAYEGI
ncbi:MAG: hypothetical protein E7663_07120 [Ruminococcaceae bacterium]|nr:hypothetical protein [Oscillospiraceae bacterium]